MHFAKIYACTCTAFGELFHLSSLLCITLEVGEEMELPTFVLGTDTRVVTLRLLGGDQLPL